MPMSYYKINQRIQVTPYRLSKKELKQRGMKLDHQHHIMEPLKHSHAGLCESSKVLKKLLISYIKEVRCHVDIKEQVCRAIKDRLTYKRALPSHDLIHLYHHAFHLMLEKIKEEGIKVSFYKFKGTHYNHYEKRYWYLVFFIGKYPLLCKFSNNRRGCDLLNSFFYHLFEDDTLTDGLAFRHGDFLDLRNLFRGVHNDCHASKLIVDLSESLTPEKARQLPYFVYPNPEYTGRRTIQYHADFNGTHSRLWWY